MIRFNQICTISYHTLGARNDLGEPSRTFTTRTTTAKCAIQQRASNIAFSYLSGGSARHLQGIANLTSHIMFLDRSETIELNDIVTDVNGIDYTVKVVVPWPTHIEAMIDRLIR